MAARVCVAGIVLATLVFSGCSGTADPRTELGITESAWDQRGTVLESAPAELTPELAAAGGDARTVVYRSVSGTSGTGTEVSGTLWEPGGDAPAGGWPVIVVGHPTTGATPDCGPSTSPDLLGLGGTLAAMVGAGFAVALPDYEGLGHPGMHPYLEPRSAGYNMIDAVRALRHEFPAVSDRWLAYGSSQGGQASWAANELADDYGGGLDFVGSVAVSPPADIAEFADLAFERRLTGEQVQFVPLIVTGLQAVHPDLVVADYLSGPAVRDTAALVSCTSAAADRKAEVAAELTADDVAPVSAEAADRLANWLQDNALPLRPLSGPMLVLYGANDNVVRADWITAAIERSCDLGATIARREQAGKGHGDVDVDEMYAWVNDRFVGRDAPSDCG